MTSSNGNITRVTGPLCGKFTGHRWIPSQRLLFVLLFVQWRRALMFSWICAWTNGQVNNRDADNLRRHRAHYDVTVFLVNRGPVAKVVTWRIRITAGTVLTHCCPTVWRIMFIKFSNKNNDLGPSTQQAHTQIIAGLSYVRSSGTHAKHISMIG